MMDSNRGECSTTVAVLSSLHPTINSPNANTLIYNNNFFIFKSSYYGSLTNTIQELTIALSAPSDARFLNWNTLATGCLITNCEDPPPSRLVAQEQPRLFIISPISSYIIPSDQSDVLPSEMKKDTVFRSGV